ncbi:hypothetical protein ACMHYO_11555 [Allopusillimonas ginsengisoli]|uniref:hypothetical protein n=1 Tax=Allopusillimonas ginsengisoli TaxID=453575 RepID=UPI0039C137C5
MSSKTHASIPQQSLPTPPATIGQPWPEQGGIYIGPRLIDGQIHYIIIPGGVEYDIKACHNSAAESIAAKGEINGFCDWHHGSQGGRDAGLHQRARHVPS